MENFSEVLTSTNETHRTAVVCKFTLPKTRIVVVFVLCNIMPNCKRHNTRIYVNQSGIKEGSTVFCISGLIGKIHLSCMLTYTLLVWVGGFFMFFSMYFFNVVLRVGFF